METREWSSTIVNEATTVIETDSDAVFTANPPSLSRVLSIEQYTRAHTGVWYYQVDIEVWHRHYLESSNTLSSSDVLHEEDVQYYSVRRRYSEFLQLYEAILQELEVLVTNLGERWNCQVPAFPQKEYLSSSSVLGLLWRTTSSTQVLEERRYKFQKLLQFIERHPVLRQSTAYLTFLGTPPQSSKGYVSLQAYSSQHWLSSLEQVNKEKEKRRRRFSSDASTCSILQQSQVSSFNSRRQSSKKRQRTTEIMVQNITKRMRCGPVLSPPVSTVSTSSSIVVVKSLLPLRKNKRSRDVHDNEPAEVPSALLTLSSTSETTFSETSSSVIDSISSQDLTPEVQLCIVPRKDPSLDLSSSTVQVATDGAHVESCHSVRKKPRCQRQ